MLSFVRDVPVFVGFWYFLEQRYANSPVQEVGVMKWKVPKKSGMFLLMTSPFREGGVYDLCQAPTELQPVRGSAVRCVSAQFCWKFCSLQ